METLYKQPQNMVKLITDKLSAIYDVDLFNVMRLMHQEPCYSLKNITTQKNPCYARVPSHTLYSFQPRHTLHMTCMREHINRRYLHRAISTILKHAQITR